MAEFDTLILEMTVDRGLGDELVRFSTRPVDDPNIEVRLVGSPEYGFEVGLWLWQTRTLSGVGDAELINADGGIDWLHNAIVRDKPGRLYGGAQRTAFGAFSEVAQVVVDYIGSGQFGRLRIKFVATDIQLAKTLQQDFYTDAVPVQSLVGQAVPFGLGLIYQVGAILVDESPIDYDLNIVTPAVIFQVASNSNPALPTQWDYRERGFRMNVTPAGKITADFATPQKQSGHTTDDLPAGYPSSAHENASKNSDFISWTLNKPTQYLLAFDDVASPEKKIERYFSQNRLTVINRGSSVTDLFTTAPCMAIDWELIPDRWYAIRFDFVPVGGWTNQMNGVLILTDDTLNTDPATGTQALFDLTLVGSDQTYFFKASNRYAKLFFPGSALSTVDTEVRINSIRLWPVEAAETTLDRLVPYVLDLAGWTGPVDLGGLQTLTTDIGPHTLGDWFSQAVSVETVLTRLLAPFCAWYYVDETGTMRFGRLVDPADIPGDPVLEITPEMLVEGTTPQISDDLMPGLSDTYGGRRNHHVLSQEITEQTGASLIEQELYAAQFRIIARGDGSDLDPFYSWAHDRCIVPTPLQDEVSINRERSRTASLASKPRKWCTLSFNLLEAIALRSGQKVRVTWPGKGLDAGVEFALISARRGFIGSRLNLRLWR